MKLLLRTHERGYLLNPTVHELSATTEAVSLFWTQALWFDEVGCSQDKGTRLIEIQELDFLEQDDADRPIHHLDWHLFRVRHKSFIKTKRPDTKCFVVVRNSIWKWGEYCGVLRYGLVLHDLETILTLERAKDDHTCVHFQIGLGLPVLRARTLDSPQSLTEYEEDILHQGECLSQKKMLEDISKELQEETARFVRINQLVAEDFHHACLKTEELHEWLERAFKEHESDENYMIHPEKQSETMVNMRNKRHGCKAVTPDTELTGLSEQPYENHETSLCQASFTEGYLKEISTRVLNLDSNMVDTALDLLNTPVTFDVSALTANESRSNLSKTPRSESQLNVQNYPKQGETALLNPNSPVALHRKSSSCLDSSQCTVSLSIDLTGRDDREETSCYKSDSSCHSRIGPTVSEEARAFLDELETDLFHEYQSGQKVTCHEMKADVYTDPSASDFDDLHTEGNEAQQGTLKPTSETLESQVMFQRGVRSSNTSIPKMTNYGPAFQASASTSPDKKACLSQKSTSTSNSEPSADMMEEKPLAHIDEHELSSPTAASGASLLRHDLFERNSAVELALLDLCTSSNSSKSMSDEKTQDHDLSSIISGEKTYNSRTSFAEVFFDVVTSGPIGKGLVCPGAPEVCFSSFSKDMFKPQDSNGNEDRAFSSGVELDETENHGQMNEADDTSVAVSYFKELERESAAELFLRELEEQKPLQNCQVEESFHLLDILSDTDEFSTLDVVSVAAELRFWKNYNRQILGEI